MIDERELAIHPIVQESVQHNARVSAARQIRCHLHMDNIGHFAIQP